MNCPEWEERLASGDPEAAEHLRDCPSCAAFADELAWDARLLQAPPPETSAVDYASIRAAAGRGAGQRKWRPKVLGALAAAAAALVLMTLNLPVHHDAPIPMTKLPAPPLAIELPHEAPARPSTVPKVRPRRRNSQADLDRKFADFLRAQYELKHPVHLRATEIATGNPNVTILLLQESKGNANE